MADTFTFSETGLLGKRIAQAAAKGKRLMYRDAGVNGLGLSVTDKGTATFTFIYRSPITEGTRKIRVGVMGRTPKTYKLGTTLPTARKIARKFAHMVANNEDPQEAKKVEKAPVPSGMPTVGEYYLGTYQRLRRTIVGKGRYANEPDETKGPPSWHDDTDRFERYCAGGDDPVADYRLDELTLLRLKALATHVGHDLGHARTAKMLISSLSVMYVYASDDGTLPAGFMPPTLAVWPRSGKIKTPLAEVAKRARRIRKEFMNDEQIKAYMDGCDACQFQRTRDMLKLLLLTGQRSGNVRQMRWDELDLTLGTWTIHTKSLDRGEVAVKQLTKSAVQILIARKQHMFWNKPSRRVISEYVFPAPNTRLKPVAQLGTGFRRLMRDLGFVDTKGKPVFTPHDVRRSLGHFLRRRGVPIEQIQEILGHKDYDTTARIYATTGGDQAQTDGLKVVDDWFFMTG